MISKQWIIERATPNPTVKGGKGCPTYYRYVKLAEEYKREHEKKYPGYKCSPRKSSEIKRRQKKAAAATLINLDNSIEADRAIMVSTSPDLDSRMQLEPVLPAKDSRIQEPVVPTIDSAGDMPLNSTVAPGLAELETPIASGVIEQAGAVLATPLDQVQAEVTAAINDGSNSFEYDFGGYEYDCRLGKPLRLRGQHGRRVAHQILM